MAKMTPQFSMHNPPNETVGYSILASAVSLTKPRAIAVFQYFKDLFRGEDMNRAKFSDWLTTLFYTVSHVVRWGPLEQVSGEITNGAVASVENGVLCGQWANEFLVGYSGNADLTFFKSNNSVPFLNIPFRDAASVRPIKTPVFGPWLRRIPVYRFQRVKQVLMSGLFGIREPTCRLFVQSSLSSASLACSKWRLYEMSGQYSFATTYANALPELNISSTGVAESFNGEVVESFPGQVFALARWCIRIGLHLRGLLDRTMLRPSLFAQRGLFYFNPSLPVYL